MTDKPPTDPEAFCPGPATKSLHISLVAYQCVPGKVFVAVPNERARYILTDQCVIEADCPWCEAIAGEPCHTWRWNLTRVWNIDRKPPTRESGQRNYKAGVHCARKDAARLLRGRPRSNIAPKPKLRIPVQDMTDASTELPQTPPTEETAPDIDFDITRKPQ